jgi:hypothetical protein
MEEGNKKIKRLSIWAVFLIALSMVMVFLAPPETLGHFFTLLKDIITHLII